MIYPEVNFRYFCAGIICGIILICAQSNYLASSARSASAAQQKEINAITKEIAEKGNDFALYAKRGFVYYRSGCFAQANNDFEKALSLNPNWPQGYLFRSYHAVQAGGVKAALADIAKAESMAPLTARDLAWRGDLYMKLRNYSAAVNSYTKALKLAPRDETIYASRACANLDWHGPSKSVVNDLQRSLKINPHYQQSRDLLKSIQSQ
ncbi:MAG: tetratricopeptide repeat protein [Cyanobacteria bacterium REEB67]|nr:tetratricopeptide repeat protein [Cyanobacteria bacterium REEB67]